MRYSWECNKCGQKGQQDKLIRFCPRCGNRLEITYNSVNDNSSFDLSQIKDKAHEQFCDTFEFDKLEGFNFSNFIRQMFKWHTWDEIEDYICQGISTKRPHISQVSTAWPAPWLFFYSTVTTILAMIFLYWRANFFGPSIMLPLLIFGIIGIPFSTLLFFWEMNVTKNISILWLLRTMLICGFLSIAINFFLRDFLENPRNAIWAGPIEETAKCLSMLFFLKNKNFAYKLNGLLIGATVGAGFAFIESGHYFFVHGASVINIRAVCAPFGHVAYSAIAGFGLWCAYKKYGFSFSILKDKKFLILFFLAVAIHMFWNSDILKTELVIRTAIVAVVEYFVIFYAIQEGLNEIRDIKCGRISI
jgi:RsiW-degrading membrane proteinase PrsW (M82 family)